DADSRGARRAMLEHVAEVVAERGDARRDRVGTRARRHVPSLERVDLRLEPIERRPDALHERLDACLRVLPPPDATDQPSSLPQPGTNRPMQRARRRPARGRRVEGRERVVQTTHAAVEAAARPRAFPLAAALFRARVAVVAVERRGALDPAAGGAAVAVEAVA